jgi:hypothetical protein
MRPGGDKNYGQLKVGRFALKLIRQAVAGKEHPNTQDAYLHYAKTV